MHLGSYRLRRRPINFEGSIHTVRRLMKIKDAEGKNDAYRAIYIEIKFTWIMAEITCAGRSTASTCLFDQQRGPDGGHIKGPNKLTESQKSARAACSRCASTVGLWLHRMYEGCRC